MNCAFRSLQDAEKAGEAGRTAKIIKQIALQVCLPLLAAMALTEAVSLLGDSWSKSREFIFGDILKFCSLFVISLHTFNAIDDIKSLAGAANKRAISVYKLVGQFILVVECILIIHIIFLGQSEKWAREPYILVAVAAISCAYLFFFYWGNLTFRRDNPENWGIRKFADAFMLGANIPFMLASLGIGVVAFACWSIGTQLESVLVGAVTFLIFSSTSANILIDGFARPFLAIGNPILVTGEVKCAHEQLCPPPGAPEADPVSKI